MRNIKNTQDLNLTSADFHGVPSSKDDITPREEDEGCSSDEIAAQSIYLCTERGVFRDVLWSLIEMDFRLEYLTSFTYRTKL